MTRLIREAMSPTGHPVTLVIEHNTYSGAQPFYIITRSTTTGRPQDQRFVPVVFGVLDEKHPTPTAQRRAEAKAHAWAIFEAFTRDITDPAALTSASLAKLGKRKVEV